MFIAIGDFALSGDDPFASARALALDGVEVRFGPQDAESHAFLEAGTAAAWRSRARAAGLALPSVYAGYIASHPPSHPDPDVRRRSADVLARVVEAAAEAGARTVVLPLFAAAEPRDDLAVTSLAAALAPLAERAAAVGLALGLETTLPVAALLELLRRLDRVAVRVAYDVGAAAALGYDPAADLKLLGPAVCQLRVRDCTPDGRRVLLGQGVVGARWGAIQAAWSPAEERTERWCVLEVPAAGAPMAWARTEVAFLHGGR